MVKWQKGGIEKVLLLIPRRPIGNLAHATHIQQEAEDFVL